MNAGPRLPGQDKEKEQGTQGPTPRLSDSPGRGPGPVAAISQAVGRCGKRMCSRASSPSLSVGYEERLMSTGRSTAP